MKLWKDMPESAPELNFMGKVDAALHRKGQGSTRLLLWAVCATVGILLLWASFAEIDEVARGMGQIIPSMRTQIIENREGGILREILVAEGDIVEKDALLLRVDNEGAGSQVRSAAYRVQELEALIARLEAESQGRKPIFAEPVQTQTPAIVRDQLAQHQSRMNQFLAEKSGLESQLEQQQQNVKEQSARQESIAALLANAAQHTRMARNGVSSGSVSRADLLRLEKEELGLKGELETLKVSLPRSREAVREAELRLTTHAATFVDKVHSELNAARTELNQQKELLTAGRDQMTRQEVRSPVRGIINQIHMHTRGGVVKPATPIMEIVPLDDTLLVEARMSPTDIAFLHPGQPGIVKITAYDFAIYGGLDAQVVHISPNSISDERGGIFYLVRLRTKSNVLVHRGKELPIIPGMVASVDVLTGKKTVLDYLMKPIMKARQEALRER